MKFTDLFKKKVETKSVPSNIAMSDTQTRGAISKAFRPYWLYKPPFGVPRNKDVDTFRRLGQSPSAMAVKKMVIDEINSVPWDIKPKEGFSEDDPITQAHIQEVKQFFNNPNTLKEGWTQVQSQILNDMMDLNAGVLVKEFNEMGQMVEIRAVDGATFLKNPNRFGKYDDRKDYIRIKMFSTNDLSMLGELSVTRQAEVEGSINNANETGARLYTLGNSIGSGNYGMERYQETNREVLTIAEAAQQAAYFQFGWGTGAAPIPFGTKEIVWFEEFPTTFDVYGKSPIEVCVDVLQTLIWNIDYYREYFENNNVPKGIINIEGANSNDIKEFADRWNEVTRQKDNAGLLRKVFHRVPVINAKNAKFQPIQFTATELDLIANTMLFNKILWANFGVTASEMGFTEDSNKATEIGQSRVFKRKAIYPRLKILDYYINREIMSEFEFDDVEFVHSSYDVHEEIDKWAGLYKVQYDMGFPLNELRHREGLPPIEGGDQSKNTMFTMPLQSFEGDSKPSDNPFGSQDRKKETKAMGEQQIAYMLVSILKNARKEVVETIRKEALKTRLSQVQIKSMDDILNRIKQIFSFGGVMGYVDKFIELAFSQGHENAEKQTEMNLTMNRDQLAFIKQYTFDNIKGLEDATKDQLRKVMQKGILEGQSVSQLTKGVMDVFDVSESRAKMIAITEANRAENYGQLNGIKESDLKAKKYISVALDDRTSDICKAMSEKYPEGKAIGLDKDFSVNVNGEKISAPAPPFHPNCRSSVLFKVEGVKK